MFRWALAALVSLAALHAHAQRAPVPVVDFVGVLAPEVSVPLTPERVKTAFLRAGSTLHWDVTPISDGVLEAKFDKDRKHQVVTTVRYDDKGYSVTYVTSHNMNFVDGPNVSAGGHGTPPSHLMAAYEAQKKQFAHDPFTPYAVVRADGALHPFYELWVRQLMAEVARELKAV